MQLSDLANQHNLSLESLQIELLNEFPDVEEWDEIPDVAMPLVQELLKKAPEIKEMAQTFALPAASDNGNGSDGNNGNENGHLPEAAALTIAQEYGVSTDFVYAVKNADIQLRRNPKHETWAISQKNDSFCGLNNKKRVVLFDRKNIQDSFDVLNHVYGIYDKRRRLTEDKRKGLPPVRLILADWLSINQTLEEMKQDAIVKESEHRSKCADIIYNGRDMNVCLIADLQSYNLVALGLKADRNSRKNFNLIALGNYYIEEDGSINEYYGVVENMILDRNIISDENERARLIEVFRQLKPLSKEHQRPIMFTTLSPARVVLLPDLRAYKAGEIPRVKLEGYTPEQLERLFQLEFEIDALSTPEAQPEKGAEQLSISREKLNEYGDYLVSKIDGKDWVLISKLGGVAWKTRDWGEDILNRVIQDLANRELVEVDTKDGVKRIRKIR